MVRELSNVSFRDDSRNWARNVNEVLTSSSLNVVETSDDLNRYMAADAESDVITDESPSLLDKLRKDSLAVYKKRIHVTVGDQPQPENLSEIPEERTFESHSMSEPLQPNGKAENDGLHSILRKDNHEHFILHLFTLQSVLYGMGLIVVGAVVPISEAFSNPPHLQLLEGLYLYLYSVSIVFIGFVYLYFLRRFPLSCPKTTRVILQMFSTERKKHMRKLAIDTVGSQSAGSFYLRLGAIAFGGGSLILTCLKFAADIEQSLKSNCTSSLTLARHFFNVLFSFSQLCFIFLNAKLCINRFQSLSKFGLMHLIATNISVWVRVIVQETIDEIVELKEPTEVLHKREVHILAHEISDNTTAESLHYARKLCAEKGLIGKIVEDASPYLYPCTIEYSLISAGILYVMWKNIGRRCVLSQSDNNADEAKRKAQKMRVDCSNSSRGMFLGLLVLIAAVISVVIFFVFVNATHSGQEDKNAEIFYQSTSFLIEHLSEIILNILALIAIIIAFFKMRGLRFNIHQSYGLEETLILLSLSGVYIFCLFSIFSAAFSEGYLSNYLMILAAVIDIIEATTQSVFIINGLRRSPSSGSDEEQKPGKQCVMFLLICNISLWGISTFEVMRAVANPIQLEYYGHLSWNIFMHISLPLIIFFRFHSTACLSDIWKNAWKRKL